MNENITVIGNIATEPKRVKLADGSEFTTVRIASDARKRDRTTGEWVDGEPNWYTVQAFRALGDNVYASVRVGDRVVVHGRLRLRNWTDGERKGLSAEVMADAFGPDLRWGTTTFRRVSRTALVDPAGEEHGEEPSEEDFPTELPEGAVPVPF